MILYRWQARDRGGHKLGGQLLADNEQEVAAYVRLQQCYVTKIEPLSTSNILFAKLFAPKLTSKDKENFFRQLGTLLQSGVTILRALDLLKNKLKEPMGGICAQISRDLEKGLPFSSALHKMPKLFEESSIQIIEAGEASGKLPQLFLQLAKHYKQERETKHFLLNACIYPGLVLLLSFATLGFFAWRVLPVFLELYAAMHVEPTLALSVLTGFAALLRRFPAVFLLLVVFTVIVLDRNQTRLKAWSLRLPLLATCYHDLLEVRYCRILAIMLSSGITLNRALAAAGNTLPLTALRQVSAAFSREVSSGKSLSKAAALHKGIFGPTSLEFIAVGEDCGSLAEMLLEAVNVIEKDLEARLKDLKALLEPLLMVFLALLIGCILFSLTSPIFGLITGMPQYN